MAGAGSHEQVRHVQLHQAVLQGAVHVHRPETESQERHQCVR